MKLYLKFELSANERLALEKRLGGPLSRQSAELWCEVMLRNLIRDSDISSLFDRLIQLEAFKEEATAILNSKTEKGTNGKRKMVNR